MAFLKNHMNDEEEQQFLQLLSQGKRFKEYVGIVKIHTPRILRYKIIAENKEDAEELLLDIADELLPIEGEFGNAKIWAEVYVEVSKEE